MDEILRKDKPIVLSNHGLQRLALQAQLSCQQPQATVSSSIGFGRFASLTSMAPNVGGDLMLPAQTAVSQHPRAASIQIILSSAEGKLD